MDKRDDLSNVDPSSDVRFQFFVGRPTVIEHFMDRVQICSEFVFREWDGHSSEVKEPSKDYFLL